MYEVLDGCLIEVMMIGELSLGQPKGGRSHLIEGGRLISGHLMEILNPVWLTKFFFSVKFLM